MINDILRLFSSHSRLTLEEISSAMKAKPSAVEPIMEMLVKKGRVVKLDAGCSGGSCEGCSSTGCNSSVMYTVRTGRSGIKNRFNL